tara:strand:- start:90919 stop:92028 length:1110 start_codon:yes stop_codon:yes gene_type:complete
MADFNVPFIDLQQRYQEERDELIAIFDRVMTSGHLVLTPELAEFEADVVAFTGAKHCIGLNSGTDALLMGLWAADVGRGDEVITTPVSFVATTGAIAHVGAVPVYVDVTDDQNIDPALIEAAITDKTKAIMPVHWCGRIANMAEINAIAERHGLVVIEDSAQCMGAYWKGQHGGTFGKVGAISTHPLKNLNALGDGGFLLTDDDEIDRKVRLYRNHGLESRDDCVMYGVNSRLDILNAEVLKYRLTRLEDVIARRENNVNQYRELITSDQVFIPADKPEEKNSWVMFLIQADDRDGLQAHLAENGVQSLIYYGTPLHLHTAAEKWGRYKRGDMPVAEAQCDRVLALPHHQCLTEDQVSHVAEQVNAFYA